MAEDKDLDVTSSHKNIRIKTNCWITIDKNDWNLAKKKKKKKKEIHIQRQRRSHKKTESRLQPQNNQVPYPPDACLPACMLIHVRLFATPWTVAHQAPLSMEFSRQEDGSGLPFPSPGDLPDPGIQPASLVSPALAGGFFTSWATGVGDPQSGK